MGAEDLTEERAAISAAIHSLELTIPWAFESSVAEPRPASAVFLREVSQSDLVVALVSRSHSPPVQQELDAAETGSKPILAFVRKLAPGDPGHADRHDAIAWLRERVKYREFDGMAELAYAVKDSLISELVRGYRRYRLNEADLVQIFKYAPQPPSLVVMQASPNDIVAVGAILRNELIDWYPGIGPWAQKIADEAAFNPSEVRVAKIGGEIGGLAVTREKGDGVRKFATLYVRPGFRGEAIGPRLIYDEVNRASNAGIRKAFVTFADELFPALAPLLARYGFVHEGVASGRYRAGAAEWVMAKSFVHRQVGAADFDDFVIKHMVLENGGEAEEVSHQRFQVHVPRAPMFGWFAAEAVTIITSISASPEEDYVQVADDTPDGRWLFVSMYGRPANADHWSHAVENWIDGEDLATRYFPVEFLTDGLPAILCPIRPHYADALIPAVESPTLFGPERLQIRPDNVYYRTPSMFGSLRRGSRVFFYVSSPAQSLRGSARLRELRVGAPTELVERYGTMGILKYEEVQAIADNHKGRALALVFDWYAEHARKLSRRAIANVISSFNPIGARLISFDESQDLLNASRSPTRGSHGDSSASR